jgi:lipoyl(octanoyl) transferase
MHGDVLDLGLIEYEAARRLQDQLAAEIAEGKRAPTLLLLEHPHVYTFGRRGHADNLLFEQPELKERGIAVHWVDRGGDVTYHGPGQLVGYPLIPLGRPEIKPVGSRQGADRQASESMRVPEADYVGYVRKLERVLIEVLAHFGVAGGQVAGLTGVWIQADVASRCVRCKPEDRKKPAKIAAIGVKVDARGITRHGFALNVEPDMTFWDGIVACGLAGSPIVSIADLLPEPPDMRAVKAEVIRAFAAAFQYEMITS